MKLSQSRPRYNGTSNNTPQHSRQTDRGTLNALEYETPLTRLFELYFEGNQSHIKHEGLTESEKRMYQFHGTIHIIIYTRKCIHI